MVLIDFCNTVITTCVVYVLLFEAFSYGALNILKFEANTDRGDTIFQQVKVDPTTGNVFVAGKNSLYKLDQKMNMLDFYRTGPVKENAECGNADPNCVGGLVKVDNDAKVLEVDPSSGYLLFCGSVRGGLCTMHPMLDLRGYRQLNATNGLNYVGGRSSVFAFFGNGGGVETQIPTLYAAITYDGRPPYHYQRAISARTIERKGDEFNLEYLFSNPDKDEFTAIDFDPHYKKDYIVNYIYGFEHMGFSYFVTVQKQDVYELSKYTTKLVRVCQNDAGFYSYTEVELTCRKKNGITTFYNIAQAAYLAPIGDDLANKFGISDSQYALYVAFGKGQGPESDQDGGTGLCMYAMNSVRKEFTKVQVDCYRGTGNLLPWIIQTRPKCTFCAQIASNLNDSFCGHKANVGIGSRYPLQTETNITSEHVLATSLGIVIHRGKTVAVLGTSAGYIWKVLIDGTDSPPYAAIQVASDGTDTSRAVARDMAFDRDKEHIYVLTKNSVARVPVKSCRVYKECSDCVTTRDPLSCGWCEDHCSTESECLSSSWSQTSCPPVIHSFSPRAGPIQGGTKVTIHGRNFGNASSSLEGSSATVEVALASCAIETRNATHITCRTGPSGSGEIDREVKVTVVDPSHTTVDFNIRGKASSGHVSFSYKEPFMLGFQPDLGPRSGGTKVTVTGQNLNIGSQLLITVASLPCTAVEVSSNAIVCNTSHLGSDVEHVPVRGRKTRSVSQGPVNLTIDNAHLNGGDKQFSYREDPTITDIYPMASILSGGFNITVTGSNLNVISAPRMEAVLAGEDVSYIDDCVPEESGQVMICKSPNLAATNATVTAERPLVVDIHFCMDGVLALRNFQATHQHLSRFKYTVDPYVYTFTGYNNVKTVYKDEVFLNILGENIDLAASESDVSVDIKGNPCNVTKIGTTVIMCIPNKPLNPTGMPQPTTVTIGYKKYHIGFIEYAARRTGVLIAMIAGPILGVISVVVVIMILCWMRKTRRGPFKKKAGGPDVRYQRGDQVDIGGATGEQIYRLNNHVEQNPYWTQSQLHMNQVRQRSLPARLQEGVMDEEARRLIEDSQLLIDRERLLLLEIIGQGHFGCVYKGYMKLEEHKEEVEVAVKTLKSLTESAYSSSTDARKFLDEALRMREFDHPHILRLIGICMDKEELPLVVLPFMKHGDLLSYIRDERNSPTVKELMDFGIQVAEGMAYLSSLKFVHRDLAARNCMMDDNMYVKVADFGLSRDIYERDYYSSDDRKAKLPVKWMALESLEKGIYNTKTDVWSYGVVLWELMTRGVCPYPEVDNWDIIKFLKSGRRMPQPSYCPDALYGVMLCCWEPDPKCRPSFDDLVHAVRHVIITLEQAHQHVGLDITYVNVPTTQSYLYPQNFEEPSPTIQNINNNSNYQQQVATHPPNSSMSLYAQHDALHGVSRSRSTMV